MAQPADGALTFGYRCQPRAGLSTDIHFETGCCNQLINPDSVAGYPDFVHSQVCAVWRQM